MNDKTEVQQDLNADTLSCAPWIGRFLKARGIDRVFGLQGGHIQPIWDHVARQDIRIIDVRDEGGGSKKRSATVQLSSGQFGQRAKRKGTECGCQNVRVAAASGG